MKFKDFLNEESSAQQRACSNIKKKYENVLIKDTQNKEQFLYDTYTQPTDTFTDEKYPFKVIDSNSGEIIDTLEGLFDENGKVRDEWRSGFKIELALNDGEMIDWHHDFPGLEEFHRVIVKSGRNSNVTIENFNDWPTAEYITAGEFTLKSLAGIERFPKLKALRLNANKVTDIQCGLMRLLKCPALGIFRIHLYDESSDVSDKFDKALDIIDKHLETKDIAECMDELIEAGFKEYAKL